jgi:hypothetical protein
MLIPGRCEVQTLQREIKPLQSQSQAYTQLLSSACAGSVADTPVVPWLLDLAAAQRTAQQHAAAVASLQKALEYMALPPQQDQEQQQDAGGLPQRQAQQQLQGASILPPGSSSSSSSPEVGEGVDTMTAVMVASGGNAELAQLKLRALVSSWSDAPPPFPPTATTATITTCPFLLL